MNGNEVVALVTGGASGLGEASVRSIVSNGGKVLILDLNILSGEALVKEFPQSVKFIKTDVTDTESVQSAIDLCFEEFGSLNTVVNCAGIAVVEKTIGKDGAHSLAEFEKAINTLESRNFQKFQRLVYAQI